MLYYAFAVLAAASVWMLAACDSSSDPVMDPCPVVEECDFVGQKLCMAQDETKYRSCYSDSNGCLVWDCST